MIEPNVLHKTYPQSLRKRLSAELREKYGADAPEVLHLQAGFDPSNRGGTLTALTVKDGEERTVIGSAPKFDWEEAYQRLVAACLDAWGTPTWHPSGGDSGIR